MAIGKSLGQKLNVRGFKPLPNLRIPAKLNHGLGLDPGMCDLGANGVMDIRSQQCHTFGNLSGAFSWLPYTSSLHYPFSSYSSIFSSAIVFFITYSFIICLPHQAENSIKVGALFMFRHKVTYQAHSRWSVNIYWLVR